MWARHGDWKHTLSAAVHYHCEHGDINEKNADHTYSICLAPLGENIEC